VASFFRLDPSRPNEETTGDDAGLTDDAGGAADDQVGNALAVPVTDDPAIQAFGGRGLRPAPSTRVADATIERRRAGPEPR